MPEAKCPICRKAPIAPRAKAKYCGPRCRMRAHRLRARQWYADADGNVWIDGEWAARIEPEPRAGWKATGSEVQSVKEMFPSHRVIAQPPKGRGAAGVLAHASRMLADVARKTTDDSIADELRSAARELSDRARASERREMRLSEQRQEQLRGR